MEQDESIKTFLAELYRWTKAVNLTSVKPEKAEELLIKPSLAMMEFLPEQEPLEVMEIGSGAGIPGVVLAVKLPVHRFTLIESNGKKAAFLKHVTGLLKLANVQVLTERAESTACSAQYGSSADVVVARAVNRKTVFKAAQKLLKPDGILLIHRSSKKEIPDPNFRKVAETDFVTCYKQTFSGTTKLG